MTQNCSNSSHLKKKKGGIVKSWGNVVWLIFCQTGWNLKESDGIAGVSDVQSGSKLCSAHVANSLCSLSAWLSPAAPPSASSPSLLSSGPPTHRHYNTQRKGVCDDTTTARMKKKSTDMQPGNQTLRAEKKGDGDKGFLMNSSKLSSVTLLLGEVGADLSVPMETEPVSHLSGVQAELPVETLVSMLSELSRLRVSYAWLPLGGGWWCRMEWWTVGDRSVQGDSCHRLTVPSTDGAES